MSDKNKALNELYKLLDNDMYAMTFQSIAQYRTALKCRIIELIDVKESEITSNKRIIFTEAEFDNYIDGVILYVRDANFKELKNIIKPLLIKLAVRNLKEINSRANNE